MNVAINLPHQQAAYSPGHDRPGWIPPEIGADWDRNPYAYQTEEELMPAGGPHGQLSALLMAVLKPPLEERGLMLLPDTFMLYRDAWGIQRRTAPDLLLMPKCFPAPSVYDLDEMPPPSWVAEITSQKTHLSDLENKRVFYFNRGISAYLVIDAITPQNKLREQIALYFWRGSGGGRHWEMAADKEGWLTISETGAAIRVSGKYLEFKDTATGDPLYNTDKLKLLWKEETKRADAEAKRADAAKAEIARLKALLAEKQK